MEILRKAGRLRPLISAFLLVTLTLVTSSGFAGQEQDEYEVKAAFLFNFTKFVEWPQMSGAGAFSICVLGEDPFEATLSDLTRGKTAFSRPIQVRQLKDPIEAKTCQIVFVSSTERAKAAKLAEVVRGVPVLTVGESEEFLRIGGIVALPMEGSRVNIIINTHAAQNSNLKISAKLLSLAKLYKND